MDTLLPSKQKQVPITLLFEGIRTSYFVQVTAISGITCCYGYLVTMTTKTGAYNIAVGKYQGFIFGVHIPCGSSNLWYNLLPWQQKQVLITLLFEGIRTLYLVHAFLEATAVSGIACCYGYLVTMATKSGAYNIGVGRYKDFIFGVHIP